MTHTPGPWSLTQEIPAAPWCEEVIGADGTHVVCFGHDYDDAGMFGWPPKPSRKNDYAEAKECSAANARLIAAAPDLLEALEDLAGWAGWASDELGQGHAGHDLVEQAHATIAKARGDSAT